MNTKEEPMRNPRDGGSGDVRITVERIGQSDGRLPAWAMHTVVSTHH